MKSPLLIAFILFILISCKKDEPYEEYTDPNTTTYGNGVSDIDNNNYISVIIGSQEWMASNLKTTRFANGDNISNLETSNDWIQSTSPAWCFYDNESSNNSDYGKLYNWYAANDNRNICPAGWRLPTINDYLQLINFIDDNGTLSSNIAGSQLKTIGNHSTNNGLWISDNSDATNIFSFSAKPGGKRNYQFGANFFAKFHSTSFWTSTEVNNENAVYMSLYNDSQIMDSTQINKGMGVCIRCIKN